MALADELKLMRYKGLGSNTSVLDPPSDSLPGLNPQAWDTDTAPADIPAAAAAPAESSQLGRVPLKPSTKRLPSPSMAPPEQMAAAEPPPAIAPNPPSPSSLPVPPTPSAASLGAKPPTATEKANADLEALHGQRPAAPTSNVAQRIANAILSMTRLAPVANQIVHPKWAEQQSAYENQLSDAEAAQKEAVEAERGEAYSAQKQAQAANYQQTQETRQAALQPHKGQQQLDPAWAKANLPQVQPDAKGEYWIDKEAFNTLVKPDKSTKLQVFHPGDVGVDEDGKVVYTAPAKPDKPDKDLTPEHRAAAIAAGIDPAKAVSDWSPAEAQSFQKEMARQAQSIHVNAGASGSPLTSDTLDMAADVYLKTGNLPPMGMGTAGATYRSQVLNRAAAKLKDQGGGDVAANKALYDQLKATGTQLEKARGNVLAFESTAGKNLDLAQQLSNKVGRSGSPILNRWLLAAKGQVAGDEDTQAFEAAVQTAVNEYAKVVTNNGAQGSVTDSARKEYARILSSATNPTAFTKIVGLLKQEMGNRRSGFDQQVQETNQRLKDIGGASGSGTKSDPLGIR